MKKLTTHVLTTLALIVTFGLTAYASDRHDYTQHNRIEAPNAATTQRAVGHPYRIKEGHPN